MSYPILIGSLAKYPKQQARLQAAIATAEAARTAGSIANVDFKQAKETINRALDYACEPHGPVGWKYAERWNYAHPQLHTIAGYVKKLRPDDDDATRAFLTEIAPLGELFSALKDMVSKRQPKATSDDPRDPRYVPPTVTGIAAKKVYALLTDLVADNFNALVQVFATGMKRQVTTFLAAKQKAADEGRTLSLHRYAKDQNADMNFLSRVTHDDRPRSMEVLINADADETIQKIATRNAEEIREMFVAKNLSKIVSIMDAKDKAGVALSEIKVIGHSISIGGLTGEFHAGFADGSSFDFTNSVVWVQNSRGTTFNRFPLRFHNVKLAGGVKMPSPSEERMNTVFVA